MIESLDVLREHQSRETDHNLPHHHGVLEQQLVREIHCLERQLDRVREREHVIEPDVKSETIATYQEMIDGRRRMLSNLNTEV